MTDSLSATVAALVSGLIWLELRDAELRSERLIPQPLQIHDPGDDLIYLDELD